MRPYAAKRLAYIFQKTKRFRMGHPLRGIVQPISITNRLVRTLAGLDVHELTIAEPDLEEIVIHFYQKGGEQA